MDKTRGISSSNVRIAKNTIYLYIRTFISILITLYTSRIFLQQLGFEDFGIYNLVGGVVSLFGVLNTMMASATQRFLSIEIGKGETGNVDKMLNVSITIHILLAALFLIIGEIGGMFLFRYVLKIPGGKEGIAFVVFQISMLTAVVGLIKTPYNALIMAKEKMSFYAYLSIFDVVAKLLVTISLALFVSKLLVYSTLYLLVNIIIVLCYYYYAKYNTGLPTYKVYSLKGNKEYKELLSFSTWTLLGNASSVGRDQGITFLLNAFYGVLLNAAMGIMVQISNVYSSLFLNLQSAFRPQIIQNCVCDKQRYSILLNRCMFYSMVFMGVVCIPMALCCKTILGLWLGKVPVFTVELVQLLMIKIIFASISQSVFLSLEANGKICKSQVATSIMSGLTLVLAYVVLLIGVKPYWVMGAMCFMEVIIMGYRFFLANQTKCLILRDIVSYNIFPMGITLVLLILSIILSTYTNSVLLVLVGVPTVVLLYLCTILIFMNKGERCTIMKIIEKKINKQ